MSDNDSELSLAMRRILAFAQEQMPETVFCIMSFTQVDYNGEIYSSNKIIANSEDREHLVACAQTVLANYLEAPVYDLRDVKGGMQ